jgi:predicted dehydrogenase
MLRYGIIGGGFITEFHLRALESVRGVEVAGLVSASPPHEVASRARARGLGEARVFDTITEMVPHVDVIALFSPNFCRVAALEEIVAKGGGHLKGLICEKPLGRNMREAHRMVELAEAIGAPTAYFENQIHMKALMQARTQLAQVRDAMGPPVLARSAEEHSGPHRPWFWDPIRQGGGVLSDMGCHSIAVGWYLLTPPGKSPTHLVPESVLADIGLLKWGQPNWRSTLLEQQGVDYGLTPAEDFATGIVTYRDPDTDALAKGQFTVSWMYDKQGLRLLVDALGPGYALEINTLRSPLEIFVGDDAISSVVDPETALEKATATRGQLAVQPNEPDLYGYTDENADAVRSFEAGRSALLDFGYGVEIVRLTMASYLSAETGQVVHPAHPDTRRALDDYVPLIQQGRGKEVFSDRR